MTHLRPNGVYPDPGAAQAAFNGAIISPMIYSDGVHLSLKRLLAHGIAVELEKLAMAGPLLTPDLLHRRADWLRTAAQEDTP